MTFMAIAMLLLLLVICEILDTPRDLSDVSLSSANIFTPCLLLLNLYHNIEQRIQSNIT